MSREVPRYEGRVALVTGAGSGIGRETALQLAAEGAVVWLSDIDEAAARRTAEGMEGSNVAHGVSRLDIRNESEWNTMPFFRQLAQEMGSEDAAFESIERNTPGGLAQPADVAAAILFLASEEARHVNGIDLVVDGGYVL